ncbi:hypothetical protein HAP94_08470 [Acidithiobacillus ferrivorans]|nr:hypothetical protein [Acidithiobacillus ferrivorans]
MEYLEDDQSWADKPNIINDFVEEFLAVTDGLEDASPADLGRAIDAAKAHVAAKHPYMPLPGHAIPRRFWVRQRLLQIWPAAGRHIGYPEAPHAFFAQPLPVCRTQNARLDDVDACISLNRQAWQEVTRGQS